jgi:phenylalanyl-tRNA synthetase alpha chain
MQDQTVTEQSLEQLATEAQSALRAVSDSKALESWYLAYLGRKGQITQMTRRVGELPKEDRPVFGRRANEIKRELEAAYQHQAQAIKAAEMEKVLAEGAIDVTMPGRPVARGRLHPSTQILRRIYQIWADMGFQIYRSRDVETDEYNFQLLNFPLHHPAREMQDTFYTTDGEVLLRTHTSPGQIHAMREYYPEPIRVILPGMCYRHEQISARYEIQFHQVEGLAVGYNIRFSDLKGTLNDFAQRMFGAGRKTRFRAAYFPFTEPPAGWRFWEAAWSTRWCCKMVAMTPPSILASPLAWGRSVSQCSGTVLRIYAIFGGMTYDFWSSFEERRRVNGAMGEWGNELTGG